MRPGAYRIQDDHWRFTVWAPRAERVELVCITTHRRYEMEKAARGFWTRTFDRVPEAMDYAYCLDGGPQRADPASGWQPDGVHGPSRIVDHTRYAWTDADYQPVHLDDYIIYELHIGTFTPEGTFAAAANRLADLKQMGITAVEVMPVAQFPGDRNWGYDGTCPYAVQNSYGGPNGFKDFIDAAHRLRLAVILDVVYNHLGPEGNYLRDFGPYFTDHYKTPWGEAVNFDQAHSDAVRDYLVENAVYWLRDYHIDALRLDALHAIFDLSATHFIRELTERVRDFSRQSRRTCYVIGESDLNDVRLIKPASEGGYGLDAQWSDDFHHSLHALLTGERFGYYEDFGDLSHLQKAFSDGFVYDGAYSAFRKRRHGNSSRSRPARQFVVCTQNHDQVGNRMRGDRLCQLLDFEAQKLAAGCLLLSPYIPLLFMGQEYAEDNPFLYFVSMSDPDLAEAVRKGRAEEFKGFQWKGDCPDPQDADTFQQSKLQWERRQQGRHKVMLAFYRCLIGLRKENTPYVNRQTFQVATRDTNQIIYWQRRWGRRQWLCLMNVSDRPQRFSCPESDRPRTKRLDSADKHWDGPGAAAPQELTGQQELQMPPKSICLYEADTDTNTHANSLSNISYSI